MEAGRQEAFQLLLEGDQMREFIDRCVAISASECIHQLTEIEVMKQRSIVALINQCKHQRFYLKVELYLQISLIFGYMLGSRR